jgi:hypothetical protein
MLVGRWTGGDEGGLLRLEPDGTFWAQWNTTSSPVRVWAFEGTWGVTGGACILTNARTQSWGTTNRVPDGRVDRIVIVKLDDQQLIWGTPSRTNTLTRAK